MDKWLKIEQLINQLLVKLSEWCKHFFRISIPKKVKVEYSGKKILTKGTLDKKIILCTNKFKVYYKKLQSRIRKYFETIKNLGISPSGKYKRKARPQEIFVALLPFIIPLVLKCKKWFIGVRPTTLALITVTSSVGIITGIEVYRSTAEVVEKTFEEEVVTVKKIEKKKKKRPDYYKNQEKQLLISTVSLPVYIEKVTSIKSLVIDFTLITSNRYLKQFFLEREYLIKDRLSEKIHPVIPTFPLTNEGKQIIKEKIKSEMNLLIHEWKIKGEIKSVHFHSIIAS